MTNGVLGAILQGFNKSLTQDKDKSITDDFFKSKLGLFYGKLDLINALLVTFGIQNNQTPKNPIPFASTFLFQVFREQDGSYTAQIQFNKQALTLQGACGGVTKCEITKFNSFIQSLRYQGDITQVCVSPQLPDNPSVHGASVTAIAGIGLLGSGIYYLLKKKKEEQANPVQPENLL